MRTAASRDGTHPTFLSVVCGDSERSVAGPSGPPRPGCPRVAALSARGSRGVGDDIDGDAPQGPIVPYCTYCVRLCLALAEARVPFELVMIDRNCKQSWFHDAFPAFITPAMQGSPGGNPRDPNEWVGDSRALLVAAAEQEAKVRELVDKPSVVTLDQAEKLGETLKAALVGGRAIGFLAIRRRGSRRVSGRRGVDAEAADAMSADDRRAALLRVGTETTAEIEATLRSARGPFLAGDAPGAAGLFAGGDALGGAQSPRVGNRALLRKGARPRVRGVFVRADRRTVRGTLPRSLGASAVVARGAAHQRRPIVRGGDSTNRRQPRRDARGGRVLGGDDVGV